MLCDGGYQRHLCVYLLHLVMHVKGSTLMKRHFDKPSTDMHGVAVAMFLLCFCARLFLVPVITCSPGSRL